MAETADALLRADNLTPSELRAVGQNVRRVFYWEKKDLPTYVALTKHLLATAISNAQSDRDDANGFGERVFGIGYDLASMTWPGWDEEGIDITQDHQGAGLAAAEMIVRLGEEHQIDVEVRHNHAWLLGAHRLAANDIAGAKAAWQQALELSAHDDNSGMLAWIALADEVGGADVSILDSWLSKLDDAGDDARGRAAQIKTARSVFVTRE